MAFKNPEKAKAYFKAYQAKESSKTNKKRWEAINAPKMQTINSILFFFGIGAEGLGLKLNDNLKVK